MIRTRQALFALVVVAQVLVAALRRPDQRRKSARQSAASTPARPVIES